MHEIILSGEPGPPIRAAIYARMSTEHQQYSTENQSDVIREYAAKHNMEIVFSPYWGALLSQRF